MIQFYINIVLFSVMNKHKWRLNVWQQVLFSKNWLSGGWKFKFHKWSFFYIIYTFLGSIFKPCYIQNSVVTNSVVTNSVIKRFVCTSFSRFCMQFSEVPNMSEPNPEYIQQSQGGNKQVGVFCLSNLLWRGIYSLLSSLPLLL